MKENKVMKTNAAIESFIKKYRLALTSKAKDIRITTEEAGDLIASIALIKSDREALEQLKESIDALAKQTQAKIITSTHDLQPGIDGGGFKN
jgi:hypothetical protein